MIQIRQIASEFAKAAELRVDGPFKEPSAEGFCVGKFGLIENLFDVMLVRIASAGLRKERRTDNEPWTQKA